jgi:amino acid permease
LLHRDSDFSIGTDYDGEESPNNLNMWQGAALLTADCIGTGLLALPADIHTLGYGIGLTFLVANLPINLYAGCIFHNTATAVEGRQKI